MAGTIAATSADAGQGISKYTLVWTSDASGNVSATTVDIRKGRLIQAKFIPGTSGVQPTDLYDVTVLDADSVDLLKAGGADRSNANASIVQPASPIYQEGGPVTPTVTNAGNAKQGTIILFVQ